jgi:hypothetical protein
MNDTCAAREEAADRHAAFSAPSPARTNLRSDDQASVPGEVRRPLASHVEVAVISSMEGTRSR